MRPIVAGLLFVMVPALTSAHAPAASDPDLAPWFNSLSNDDGLSCCGTSDGHILGDDEWKEDAAGVSVREMLDDGSYGDWIIVPPGHVLERVDNPTGRAVVFRSGNAIHCFVRPAQG